MSDATAQLSEPSPSFPSHPATTTVATTTTTGKPVVVRVKRKASQPPIDAFWLEINERPLKKQTLDISNLSISDALVGEGIEKFGTKKLLLQHFETVPGSDGFKDVLNFYLESCSSTEFKKVEEHRSFVKHEKQKQDERRSTARKEHEKLVKNARFEQIWKRRKEANDTDESLKEICHLYDVVRVDSQSESSEEPYSDSDAANESAILCNYLPLIREYIPEAAVDIESLKSREENFVYDVYTVDAGLSTNFEDATEYPLVQVNDGDDDFYDGASQSEYDSDDSNDEDNPRNDYPEEELSGEENAENKDFFDDLEGSDSHYENEDVDTDEEDEQDSRWSYR